MGAIFFMVGMIVVFLIISILFLCGKGSILIAGYNTSSKEEKEKYDEKKMCRATGVMHIIITAMLSYLTYNCYKVETGKMLESDLGMVSFIFCGVVILCVIGNIIFINKYCKKVRS